MKRLYVQQRRQDAELGMRRNNTAQLNLFELQPRSRQDVRAAVLAMFATTSASAVAARVGVSRASVLGIAKRARDAGRPVELVRPTSARAQRRAAKVVAADAFTPRPSLPPIGVRPATVGTPMPTICRDPAPLIVVDVDGMPHLFTVGERECRAIIDEDGACCRLPTEGRSSWCRAHRAAYRASARPLHIREDLL